MSNSSSNIFIVFLLLERYYQNCQAILAATGMNGLSKTVYFSLLSASEGTLSRQSSRPRALVSSCFL